MPRDIAAAQLPRSLPAWLPFLWSRVLFSGVDRPNSAFRWRSLLLLLVLPGALLYPCLDFHLFEPDEGRYAEIPREMLVRGEWVVPQLQGQPYLDKPPLLYWLVMLSYQLFGVDDWSARLVPALAMHACILCVYLIGRRSIGERSAFWGGLLLSLAPGFISMGRLLVLDGLLTLWVTLSILGAFEAVRGERFRWSWWLLASAACGLGVLTKGPVAVVLLAVPLGAYRLLTKQSQRVPWSAVFAFLSIVVAVCLPWTVALCHRQPEFLRYFIWEHNVVRYLTGFDHKRPVWFYGPVLLTGLLPATLLLLPFVRFLFSGDVGIARRRIPELGFLLLAGGWCVAFFSLSGSKLPTYILPSFPLLALALGYYVANSNWRFSHATHVAAALMFVGLFTAHLIAVPWYAECRSPMGRPEEILRHCGDPGIRIVCYARNCDSVAFYLGRDDLRSYHSKHTHLLIQALFEHPRTVILCTHRHSLSGLQTMLPPQLRLVDHAPIRLRGIPGLAGWFAEHLNDWIGETPWGLCDVAVVERH